MARGTVIALAISSMLAGPLAAQGFIAPTPEPTRRAAPTVRVIVAPRAAAPARLAAPSDCERLATAYLAYGSSADEAAMGTALRTCAVESQARPQDDRTAYLYGTMLEVGGNHAGALKVYARLSVRGYAPSITRLGDFYANGYAGLGVRPGQACTLWTRAARAGDPLALPKAGSCLVAEANPIEQRQIGCQFLVDGERANVLDPAALTLRRTTCAGWQ